MKAKPNNLAHNRASVKGFIMVLILSSLLAAITVDMVNPVLGLIGDSLHAAKAQVSWVVSGITLLLAIGIPLYGRMSDFFELRKLFAFAASVLALGSLICALAPSLPLLVFGRMVQGAGMSAIPVLSVVSISKVFAEGERGAALGVVMGCIGIGTAFGPIFGGFVGQAWGWPALFWIAFVLSLLIVVGAVCTLPVIKPEIEQEHGQRMDWIGGVLLGLTTGLFLFGLTQGESVGFTSLASLGSLFGAVCALVAFIWRIRTASDPFVPAILFKNRPYIHAVAVAYLSAFAYFAVLVFVPLLLVEANGLTPGEAGVTLLPGGAAVALLSPWVGRISDRAGSKPLVIAGLIVMGISTLFLSIASGASALLVSLGVIGVGIAFAFINSPANSAAVGVLEKAQVGAGMGLFQGALYFGAGSGAGIIGAFLHARSDASHSLNPFYKFEAIGYSDSFLAAAIAVIFALIASFGLKSDRK
ncbi:MFS transporter [Paenibacillus sp. OAS669]|uniref:MFS transporter n=1 Tax=Paenibacillus sp. OAS669 TaxID=2663821 RepID=UPI00178B878F|nr:MFS transporter [Paenibacillus sp. OAS669]MBE1443560.1 DHA2 family florfenicol/chloramphenicol resistance protein-like MFS transporter [Paenibacillus sp. OAS669]